MKILLIILLLAIAGSAQTIQDRIKALDDSKTYAVKYDKFKDETTVTGRVGFRLPKGHIIDTMELEMNGTFPGQTPNQDIAEFQCYFIQHYSQSWVFLHDQHLIMLLDGVKVDFGQGKQGGEARLGGVDEWVYFKISREDLQKIADAKTVEIQLASYEGRISQKTQPRLKAFLDLTKK
ncbi:MAG: hypothetical protein ABI878_14820 [Acidobacteriota bacterium]